MKHHHRFAFAILAALVLGVTAVAVRAIPVQGSGEGHAISQNQFQSDGLLRVGSATYSVISTATVLSLGPGPGNSLVGTSTHTIDFGNGDTLTTSDTARLHPVDNVGNYQLQIQCDITGGTGALAGATGDLMFSGRVNLATGVLTWQVHGQLR